MTPWRAPDIVFLFVASVALMVAGAAGYLAWPPHEHALRSVVTGLPFLGGLELTVYTGVGLVVQKVKW